MNFQNPATAGRTGIATIVVILVLVAIALIAGVIYVSNSPQQSSSISRNTQSVMAVLSVQSFNAPTMYSNRSATITLIVENKGPLAHNVQLALTSQGFPTALSTSQDVGSQATYQLNVRPLDIKNGVYPVAVTANYTDNGGKHQINLGNAQITLAPMIKFTDIGWLWPAFSQPKSTISTTDNTESHVSIQSLSTNAQYGNITVNETFSGDHQGLSITPASLPINLVGPQGKSNELKFTVTSNHAPTGQYTIVITAVFNGVEVTRSSVVLTVA